MWFEMLPAAGVMLTAMTLGFYGTHAMPYLILGTRYMKQFNTNDDLRCYYRDWRVTGNPYSQKGLEGIPDEDEKK